MKLTEIKYTEDHQTKLSELKALETLRERCRNAHASAKAMPIFKKFELDSPYFLIQPSQAPHKKHKFLVDDMLQSLGSWKRFPDRALSVRGYTSHERAEARGDGEMYLVLPFDGSKIAVTSAGTFIRSFDHAAKLLHLEKMDNAGLCDWLESVVKAGNAAGAELKVNAKPATAQQLFKALEKLEVLQGQAVKKKLQAVETDDSVSDVDVRRALSFCERRGSAEGYFNELLDPEHNGFDLLSTSSTFPTDREVWTGGKCLIILATKYDELHKKGDIK